MNVQRAERVRLPIPISYHRPGDAHWFQAKVMNMSESGVLFGPTDLEPGATVEIIISPPVQVGSFATGKQVCVGEVVRVAGAGAVAARFEDCRFLLDS
jgi:hypothetical protein